MRIEVKGLIAAVIGGLIVVGGAFGVSAIVVGAQKAQDSHTAVDTTRAAQAPGAPTPVINAAFVAQGHTLFTQSCASCHGANGAGGYGPNLHHEDMSDAQIALKIKNGVTGKMPAFGSKYNDGQTQTLVAYIRSLK